MNYESITVKRITSLRRQFMSFNHSCKSEHQSISQIIEGYRII